MECRSPTHLLIRIYGIIGIWVVVFVLFSVEKVAAGWPKYFEGVYRTGQNLEDWDISINYAVDSLLRLGYSYRGRDITEADLNYIASKINTPEKASAFTTALEYENATDSHIYGTFIYSAAEVLQRGEGLRCRDQHSFVTYVLRKNGYNAYTVSYVAADKYHAVTFYQDKDSKKWNMLEYESIHHLNSATLDEAIHKGIPGGFKYWIYSNPKTPDAPPSEYGVILTEHAKELTDFIIGPTRRIDRGNGSDLIDVLRDGLYDLFHLGDYNRLSDMKLLSGFRDLTDWTFDAGSNSMGSRISLSYRFLKADVQYNFSNTLPLLQNSLLAALRFEPRTGAILSFGYGKLPQTYSLDVLFRNVVSQPTEMIFAAGTWTPTLLSYTMKDSLFKFVSYADCDFSSAFPVNGVEPKGIVHSLTDADADIHNQVIYKPAGKVSLKGNFLVDFPVGQLAHYFSTRGDFGRRLPINLAVEIEGVFRIRKGLANGLSLYFPLGETFSNEFDSLPHWQFLTATNQDKDFHMEMAMHGGITKRYIQGAALSLGFKSLSLLLEASRLNHPYLPNNFGISLGINRPIRGLE